MMILTLSGNLNLAKNLKRKKIAESWIKFELGFRQFCLAETWVADFW